MFTVDVFEAKGLILLQTEVKNHIFKASKIKNTLTIAELFTTPLVADKANVSSTRWIINKASNFDTNV